MAKVQTAGALHRGGRGCERRLIGHAGFRVNSRPRERRTALLPELDRDTARATLLALAGEVLFVAARSGVGRRRSHASRRHPACARLPHRGPPGSRNGAQRWPRDCSLGPRLLGRGIENAGLLRSPRVEVGIGPTLSKIPLDWRVGEIYVWRPPPVAVALPGRRGCGVGLKGPGFVVLSSLVCSVTSLVLVEGMCRRRRWRCCLASFGFGSRFFLALPVGGAGI